MKAAGNALYGQGNWEEAAEKYSEAVEAGEMNEDALYIGFVFFALYILERF